SRHAAPPALLPPADRTGGTVTPPTVRRRFAARSRVRGAAGPPTAAIRPEAAANGRTFFQGNQKEVIPMVGSFLLPADVEHGVGFCRTGREDPNRKYIGDARTTRATTAAASSNKGERVMWLMQKFIVRKHERALLYKDGDFVAFLVPGTHVYFDLKRRYSLERFDITRPAFEHRLADFLLEAERAQVERLFEIVETRANEAAV